MHECPTIIAICTGAGSGRLRRAHILPAASQIGHRIRIPAAAAGARLRVQLDLHGDILVPHGQHVAHRADDRQPLRRRLLADSGAPPLHHTTNVRGKYGPGPFVPTPVKS